MGAKTAFSGSYTAATETDLYTNTSETEYAIALKIAAYNPDSGGHNIEIWITDGSNVKKECLFKAVISGYALISDGSKTFVNPGYKIRFTSDDADVKFSAHMFEGIA